MDSSDRVAEGIVFVMRCWMASMLMQKAFICSKVWILEQLTIVDGKVSITRLGQ